MNDQKKKNPDKRDNPITARFTDREYQKVCLDADAIRHQPATYLRVLAVGTAIRIPRSLPASDRALLATAIGALNDVGATLIRIAEELEIGDVPLDSTIIRAVFATDSALKIIEQILARNRQATDEIVSELSRA